MWQELNDVLKSMGVHPVEKDQFREVLDSMKKGLNKFAEAREMDYRVNSIEIGQIIDKTTAATYAIPSAMLAANRILATRYATIREDFDYMPELLEETNKILTLHDFSYFQHKVVCDEADGKRALYFVVIFDKEIEVTRLQVLSCNKNEASEISIVIPFYGLEFSLREWKE